MVHLFSALSSPFNNVLSTKHEGQGQQIPASLDNNLLEEWRQRFVLPLFSTHSRNKGAVQTQHNSGHPLSTGPLLVGFSCPMVQRDLLWETTAEGKVLLTILWLARQPAKKINKGSW
jgi:hypothetical protein